MRHEKIRETRELLGELMGEAKFLVRNLDNSDDNLVIDAGSSSDIEKAVSSWRGAGYDDQGEFEVSMKTARASEIVPRLFAAEKDVSEKLLSMPNALNAKPAGFGDAGREALAIITSKLSEDPSSKALFLRTFPQGGANWDDTQLKMLKLGSGGATETTGKGEIALFTSYRDIKKPDSKSYDLKVGETPASVKYFSTKPDAGPRIASGAGEESEKARFLGYLTARYPDHGAKFGVPNLSSEGLAALYEEVSKDLTAKNPQNPQTPEQVAKNVSSFLHKTLTNDGRALLIGCSDTGFKVMNEDEICFVNISDGRARLTVAPNKQIGSTTYSESRWVPKSAGEKAAERGAEAEKTKSKAKAELLKTFGNVKKLEDLVKAINGNSIKLLNKANFAVQTGLTVAGWEAKASELTSADLQSPQAIVAALTTGIPKPVKPASNESRTRGSSRKRKREFSGAGAIAGVVTPLGTGPDGRPTGLSKKSVLKKNAKTQGKSFGGAKPVNEVSNSLSMVKTSFYMGGEGGGYDVDADGDIQGYEKGMDTASAYRGGGGDLRKHAKISGRAFANAEPITSKHKGVRQESVEETRDLLWELLDLDDKT